MNRKSEIAYQLYKVAQEQYRCGSAELNSEERVEALRIAERKLHIEIAVLQSPEAARISMPEDAVDRALQEMRDNYRSDSQFEAALSESGIDSKQLRKIIARELRVNAVLDYVASKAPPVSDTEASLYYFMNLAKFEQPEIRSASHILITVNEDNSENLREKSLRRSEDIQKRLIKKPDRFAEQALKHSECPTALRGGSLGKVKRGVLFPELDSTLFTMNEGELSAVVESPLGFHILRCDAIQLAGTAPLQQVMPKLLEFLEEKSRKRAQREWLQDLLQASQSDNIEENVNG